MYKKEDKQNSIFDFNEAYGLKLDENNRLVPYGERFSEKENITYKQLLRLF